jgi:hypothetical protein
MAEVLVEFTEPITSGGQSYIARACGGEMLDGMWQGWIEFVPRDGGEPVRGSRETTQPNRQDTEYWATGLTYVYLEGALKRAMQPLVRPAAREIEGPFFDGPASPAVDRGGAEAVLNPFSVYRKGEALLRRQLSALSGWHLVNIVRAYRLEDGNPSELQAMEPARLVERIIDRVRALEAPRGSAAGRSPQEA